MKTFLVLLLASVALGQETAPVDPSATTVASVVTDASSPTAEALPTSFTTLDASSPASSTEAPSSGGGRLPLPTPPPSRNCSKIAKVEDRTSCIQQYLDDLKDFRRNMTDYKLQLYLEGKKEGATTVLIFGLEHVWNIRCRWCRPIKISDEYNRFYSIFRVRRSLDEISQQVLPDKTVEWTFSAGNSTSNSNSNSNPFQSGKTWIRITPPKSVDVNTMSYAKLSRNNIIIFSE